VIHHHPSESVYGGWEIELNTEGCRESVETRSIKSTNFSLALLFHIRGNYLNHLSRNPKKLRRRKTPSQRLIMK
jgi:hypothetical protein